MATPSRTRPRTSDRSRIASERHEISYAASRLEKGGRSRGAGTRAKAASAAKRAKSPTARKAGRPAKSGSRTRATAGKGR